jgi:hypothetical protein
MSVITERPIAPPTPEEPVNDEFLRELFNNDPDEITYAHPYATFSTTRAEREKAAQSWKNEGQVDYPDNAEENLRRTEDMLRLRLKMSPRERDQAIADLVSLHSNRLPKFQFTNPLEAATPHSDEPTGALSPDTVERERQRQLSISTEDVAKVDALPDQPAKVAEIHGLQPKHRRFRAPLRHLIRRTRAA